LEQKRDKVEEALPEVVEVWEGSEGGLAEGKANLPLSLFRSGSNPGRILDRPEPPFKKIP